MKAQHLVVLLTALLLTACSGGDSAQSGKKAATPPKPASPAPPTPAPAVSLDPVAEAADLFKVRCSTCHGPSGKGDGVAAAAFPVKPRDLTLAEWQSSVTDEHIEKIIKLGGGSVGKSPLMPPNPDLMAEGKAAVVVELRKLVRSFGKTE